MDGDAAMPREPPTSGIETTADSTSTTAPSPVMDSLFSLSMPSGPNALDVAFAALQYLPMPVVVLSSHKTVVIANEAMGRLLRLNSRTSRESEETPVLSTTDQLYGQTLSQIGIDALINGAPVWVKWDVGLEFWHILSQQDREMLIDTLTAIPRISERVSPRERVLGPCHEALKFRRIR